MPRSTNLINAQKSRSDLYARAKALNLPVRWNMKTTELESIVSNHANEDKASIKISNLFKMNKAMRQLSDLKALKVVNNFQPLTLSLQQFERIRGNIYAPPDKKMIVHFKDSHGTTLISYPMNTRQIKIQNLFVDEEDQYSSGADVDLNILPTALVEIEWMENPKYSHSERKRFFRYFVKSNVYDLKEFQVYSEFAEYKSDHAYNPLKDSDDLARDFPCFPFSLLKAGVDAKIVNQITQKMHKTGATVDCIRKIAIQHKLHISVKQYRKDPDGKANSKPTHYGPRDTAAFKIGSVGEHLFAIKPTKITKAALDNPDIVDKLGRTDFVMKHGKPSFNSEKMHFLDSYEVISYLYHHRERLLNPITQRNMPLLLNNKFQEVRELSEEDFADANFKELGRCEDKDGNPYMKTGHSPFKKTIEEDGKKKLVDDNDFNVIYYDFETLVENGIHEPYCISYSIAKFDANTTELNFSETKCIYSRHCDEMFLNELPFESKNLLWAHNTGFDSRFLLRHLSFSSKGENLISTGTKVKQAAGFYQGSEIVFKDTQSFLAGSLADLPSMFKEAIKDIAMEKECFPHKLINADNYRSMWTLDYLKQDKDYEVIVENATKIGAIVDNLFDCKKYAIHYCNRDVDVLKMCFEAYRKLTFIAYKLDVYRFLSLSSLSIAFQHNEGCFDGCYSMNSVLLGFMREATVGGRVMVRDNSKFHIKHKLADFDAVSLYPSAMNALPGYVRGKAKMFKNKIPDDADFYVARVRFDSLQTTRHFPLLSFFEDGSRNFTNDIVGKTMILGKQSLEDIKEFQGVSYTVLEGCYWNEGFNEHITTTIRKMFDNRVEYKRQKNAMQAVEKLMMNSSYGQLLMKSIVKKNVFVSNSKTKPNAVDDFTRKNIHKLISRTPVNDRLSMFELHKPLGEHFAPVHLGIQVLDSSKNIMNKVMCLAEDINAKIWYQDTDSMHIDFDDVERLGKAYFDKYGKIIIGEDMGQFNVDFTLKGSKGDIFATESIFLAKKSYIDVLACSGNDATDVHARMKGTPSKLLQKDTLEIYKDLFDCKMKKFDLTDVCPIDINAKTQVVSKRVKFEREVHFPKEGIVVNKNEMSETEYSEL